MLEKALENSLDSKIKPVSPKGNQPWTFIGRIDAEAPILKPPDVRSWLTGKDPGVGKDWGQTEKAVTKDETVGCITHINGHELGQTPGDCEGQGSLACCSPWGCKEPDTTEQLNKNNHWNTNVVHFRIFVSKHLWASLVAQMVKRLPATRETWVQSLGQEDPLKMESQPTTVLLPGQFHGQRSLVGYSPWGCKESDTTERLHFFFLFFKHLWSYTVPFKRFLC